MRPLKIVLLVLGSLLALFGIGSLIGGLVLGWAYGTQRDDDGYFTTPAEEFASDAYAITTEEVHILIDPGTPDWISDRAGEVKLRADALGEAVFIGIGPESDVEAYLQGVAYDEIDDIHYRPFDVDYRSVSGDGVPAPPADQGFWVAQASGPGTQELNWEIESGNWIVVLMNADGSAGVAAEVQAAGRSDLLPGAIAVLIGVGVALLLVGTALILGGALGQGGPEGAAVPGAAPGTAGVPAGRVGALDTAVRLEGRLDEPLSRWLWLVKWLLAIPHFIVLFFLWIGFAVLTVVAGFAILFTGRYPRGIFDYNVGVMRWTWRVSYYATNAIATDRYPPFSLSPHLEYPAVLEVAYPAQLSRGLVLVKWWLLAIPHYLVLAFLTSAPTVAWTASESSGGWQFAGGGGLITLLVFIAGVVLLFRSRYPLGVYNLLMGINRWSYRVLAYAALMTDRYPPFRLDQGPIEPERVEPRAEAAPPA